LIHYLEKTQDRSSFEFARNLQGIEERKNERKRVVGNINGVGAY
jgi:hypothetical protein